MEEGPRKEGTLAEALKFYNKVIHQLHLPSVCTQLREGERDCLNACTCSEPCSFSAQCFGGIVDLSLCAASRLDPQSLGLAYYKNGSSLSEENSQLRQAYANRLVPSRLADKEEYFSYCTVE